MTNMKEWRKTFKLTLHLGNAAFENRIGYETARILRELANKIEETNAHDGGQCADINGNTVGSYTFLPH